MKHNESHLQQCRKFLNSRKQELKEVELPIEVYTILVALTCVIFVIYVNFF